MARILIVEDHDTLLHSLKQCVENEGFSALLANGITSARERAAENPDLILLDWMLPDGQGIDFLAELRRSGCRIPVILLTARAETVDKVLGLELGATDYITKPFEPRELVARIRARLRERNVAVADDNGRSGPLQVGNLAIDRCKHLVRYKQKEITLVKKEFDLLVLLAESPEKVFSRDELLNKVWGYDVFPTTRTVDTHVMLLRQKIDANIIETVRSVGYKFKPL